MTRIAGKVGVLAAILISPLLRAAAAPSAIPLRVADHRQVLVPVKIGAETVLLGLDLGADDQMGLVPRAVDLVHAKRQAGSHAHLDVNGNVLADTPLAVPEVRIGDITFSNVAAVEQKDVPYHMAQVFGHIGRGLLLNYRVELDLPHNRMWLWPRAVSGAPDDHCQGKVIPVLSEVHGIRTRVTTDYGELTMLWDDGAPVNIIHPEVLKSSAGAKPSEHVTTQHFILNGTNFGPQELYPMSFSQPSDIDGFIGYDLLAKHDVCFDLPGQRVVIRK